MIAHEPTEINANILRLQNYGPSVSSIKPTEDAIKTLSELLLNNVGGGAMDFIWGEGLELIDIKEQTEKITLDCSLINPGLANKNGDVFTKECLGNTYKAYKDNKDFQKEYLADWQVFDQEMINSCIIDDLDDLDEMECGPNEKKVFFDGNYQILTANTKEAVGYFLVPFDGDTASGVFIIDQWKENNMSGWYFDKTGDDIC